MFARFALAFGRARQSVTSQPSPESETRRGRVRRCLLFFTLQQSGDAFAFFDFVLFHALEGLKIADYPATANLDEEVFVVRLGVELLAHLALGLG